jgi:AraC family transcriptional regulator, transcriptional activator of pobA
MDKIIKLESFAQFNTIRGQEILHPLVTILDQAKSKPLYPAHFIPGLYLVYLKEAKCGELKYGRNNYDYEERTLVLIASGQVYGVDENMNEYRLLN